jgi:hypothetical protein
MCTLTATFELLARESDTADPHAEYSMLNSEKVVLLQKKRDE